MLATFIDGKALVEKGKEWGLRLPDLTGPAKFGAWREAAAERLSKDCSKEKISSLGQICPAFSGLVEPSGESKMAGC